MRKIKEILVDILSILFWLFFIYAEIVGIFHSFHKHGIQDGIYAISFPPLAWYRSLEIFWHDDYDGINWEEQLENDFDNIANFFDLNGFNKVNKVQIDENIKIFSNKIKDYPQEKIEFLKHKSRLFTSFYIYLMKDGLTFSINYLENGSTEFSISKATLEYEKSLNFPKISAKYKKQIENYFIKQLNFYFDRNEFNNYDKSKFKETITPLYENNLMELNNQFEITYQAIFKYK